MQTQNIYIFETNSTEQDDALKAFAKALKLKFEVKKVTSDSAEKSLLIEEIKEAVHNLNLVKQGKLKGKSARELLNEL